MQSNVLDQKYLRLSEAAKSLPGRPRVTTLHRWRSRGLKGVHLECVRIGGRWFVNQESLARFFRDTTRAADKKQGSRQSSASQAAASTDRGSIAASHAGVVPEDISRDEAHVAAELDDIGIRARNPRRDRGKEGN